VNKKPSSDLENRGGIAPNPKIQGEEIFSGIRQEVQYCQALPQDRSPEETQKEKRKKKKKNREKKKGAKDLLSRKKEKREPS